MKELVLRILFVGSLEHVYIIKPALVVEGVENILKNMAHVARIAAGIGLFRKGADHHVIVRRLCRRS